MIIICTRCLFLYNYRVSFESGVRLDGSGLVQVSINDTHGNGIGNLRCEEVK